MNADEIQMFAAATEIQDQWTPRLCDRVCLKDSTVPKVDYVVRETLERFDSYYIRRWCTWLPYQHQLQDILQQDIAAPDCYTSICPSGMIEYLQDFMIPEESCPEEWFCVRCGALGIYRRKTFKTMDTAMLGVVMDMVYGKYWWQGNWYKRLDERY